VAGVVSTMPTILAAQGMSTYHASTALRPALARQQQLSRAL
jgi:hypothetical protein